MNLDRAREAVVREHMETKEKKDFAATVRTFARPATVLQITRR